MRKTLEQLIKKKQLEDELNEKYKDYGKQQLIRELTELKKKQNKDIASIRFISKLLRNKIDNKNNKIFISDHDAEIKKHFWGYTQFDNDENLKPSFNKQRSLVVTLLDLKNAFGEVHHNLIHVVLDYHHVPPELIECIMSLYKEFATAIVTDSYTTSFLRIERGVLQSDCLSPLIFNLLINTFIQYVRQKRFSKLGYSL